MMPEAPQERRGAFRAALDRLYDGAAALSAACLVGLLGVIVAQMVARWSGVAFPGSSEYAGYLMAAASFFAFAHALNRGAHIRVSLMLTALGMRRFWGELWCLLIGSAATLYLAWYAVKLVRVSRKLGDLSQGQDAMPLWIVQLPVAAGSCLLALAFLDNLATLLLTRRTNMAQGMGEA
jgi:TRAP-type C4-dicarboxylate transport system permease small subunit